MFRRFCTAIHQLTLALQENTKETKKMSAATDRLAASVATLSTAVDALVARLPADDSAAVNAAADQVDALTAKVNAAAPAPAA